MLKQQLLQNYCAIVNEMHSMVQSSGLLQTSREVLFFHGAGGRGGGLIHIIIIPKVKQTIFASAIFFLPTNLKFLFNLTLNLTFLKGIHLFFLHAYGLVLQKFVGCQSYKILQLLIFRMSN